MSTRIVGLGGLAFVTAMASLLGTVIARSPDTHDNIAPALRADYARTPLDSVEPLDLQTVLVDLPDFTFPEPPEAVASLGPDAAAPQQGPDGVITIPDDSTAPSVVETVQVMLSQFEFGFDPDRIELKAGVPVELVVTNQGDQVHGIWIPDFAISEDIRSGKSKTFTFTPTSPGRVRFTCSYNLCGTEEEHAQMKGFITVK